MPAPQASARSTQPATSGTSRASVERELRRCRSANSSPANLPKANTALVRAPRSARGFGHALRSRIGRPTICAFVSVTSRSAMRRSRVPVNLSSWPMLPRDSCIPNDRDRRCGVRCCTRCWRRVRSRSKDVASALRWQERLSEGERLAACQECACGSSAMQKQEAATRGAGDMGSATRTRRCARGKSVRLREPERAHRGRERAVALAGALRCACWRKLQAALAANRRSVRGHARRASVGRSRSRETMARISAKMRAPSYGTTCGTGACADLPAGRSVAERARRPRQPLGRSLQLVRDAKQAAAFRQAMLRLLGELANTALLGALATRRQLVRLAVIAEPKRRSGVVRFALGGANAKRDVLSTSELLPAWRCRAAVAVVEAAIARCQRA